MDQSSFIRWNVENDKNTKQLPLQLLCKINSGRWSSMQKVRFRYHIPQLWAILTIETSCVQSLDSNNRNKLHATKSLVFSSLVRISTPTSWALTLLLFKFLGWLKQRHYNSISQPPEKGEPMWCELAMHMSQQKLSENWN